MTWHTWLLFVATETILCLTPGPETSVPLQVGILAITSFVIEFAVLATYGHLAGRAMSAARGSRFITVTNRAGGAMLVAAGSGLAWTNR